MEIWLTPSSLPRHPNDVITRKLGDRVKEKRQGRDETLSGQNRLGNIPQTPHEQNSFLVKEPPPIF